MKTNEFLSSICDGKWFQVNGNHGEVFAVKMKATKEPKPYIQSIWLSFMDTEAMCFAEYSPTDWSLKNGSFVHHSSGVYQFGSPEGSDSIYDPESGELIEERLKKEIFSYAPGSDLLTENEFDQVWTRLKNRVPLELEVLSYV